MWRVGEEEEGFERLRALKLIARNLNRLRGEDANMRIFALVVTHLRAVGYPFLCSISLSSRLVLHSGALEDTPHVSNLNLLSGRRS